jgi:hypothetical protein
MAAGGQFYWPSAGIVVAAYGQFFMAANKREDLGVGDPVVGQVEKCGGSIEARGSRLDQDL